MSLNEKRLVKTNEMNPKNNELICNKKRRFGDHLLPNVMDVKDSIVANFSQLYLSPKYSDITLKVDNESIVCHKSILGSQSDFFDKLFSCQMMESTQNEIQLKETDPKLFRLLLKLTYFGEIDLQDIQPMDIIKLFGIFIHSLLICFK